MSSPFLPMRKSIISCVVFFVKSITIFEHLLQNLPCSSEVMSPHFSGQGLLIIGTAMVLVLRNIGIPFYLVGMRIIAVFLLVFVWADGCAQDSDTLQKWTFCNGTGIGYDEGTVLATDHVNVAYRRFTAGIFARWSARNYWRDVNLSPYSVYHEYKFTNEFSALLGWRFGHQDQNMFVLMAGPMYRNENARWWPDKGSGMTPLIGRMLDDVDPDDVRSNGAMITAEWIHTNIAQNVGVSVLIFGSVVSAHVGTGITVNFMFGRMKPAFE